MGSLAVLAVAGGSVFSGIDGHIPWQRDSASAAAMSTPPLSSTSSNSDAHKTAQTVASDAIKLSNVKRIVWSIDGKLLGVSNAGSLLRNLQGSKFDVNTLPSGDHVLTAHVETNDGRTLSFSAPFTSSKQSGPTQSAPKQSGSQQSAPKPAAHGPQVAQAAAHGSITGHVSTSNAKVAKPSTTTPSKPTSQPSAKPSKSSATPVAQPPATKAPRPATPRPTAPAAPPSTAPAAPGGGFDPVHFNWDSVGGPSSGMTTVGGNGTLVLQTAGQLLDRVKSNTKVVASSTGVSLSNCSVGVFHADAEKLSAKNCDINGGVFGAGSYTLDHNFITSASDGIDPTGPGYKVIQYNKIWRDGTRVDDRHQDGIQFTQGGNALIARNYISGWQTSAIMIKADLGTISNITIDSNYLNNPTGYYQLYLCPDSHSLSNITVTNNAFGKASSTLSTCGANYTYVHTEAQRQAAIKSGVKNANQWIVWNGNYVAATGAVVAPPGGWAQ
jgi:hypothetical protein